MCAEVEQCVVACIRLGTVQLHVCVACVAACVQRLYKYVTNEINRTIPYILSQKSKDPRCMVWPRACVQLGCVPLGVPFFTCECSAYSLAAGEPGWGCISERF